MGTIGGKGMCVVVYMNRYKQHVASDRTAGVKLPAGFGSAFGGITTVSVSRFVEKSPVKRYLAHTPATGPHHYVCRICDGGGRDIILYGINITRVSTVLLYHLHSSPMTFFPRPATYSDYNN